MNYFSEDPQSDKVSMIFDSPFPEGYTSIGPPKLSEKWCGRAMPSHNVTKHVGDRFFTEKGAWREGNARAFRVTDSIRRARK